MRSSTILGTGSYLPDAVIENASLSGDLGISPEAMEKRSGIRQRRRASDKEATSDLATAAAEKALAAAALQPSDVDLIVVATTSPDMPFPSTACIVQNNLGARRVPAFDIGASCSGFLYALHTAESFVLTGQIDRALVIASEVKSRFVNPRDPETAYLFGDGAGAVILGGAPRSQDGGPEILWTRLYADGSHHRWIELPAGGSRLPATPQTLREGLHTMRLDGGRIFRAAVREMSRNLREGLEATGLSIPQISHFFFHQANLRILKKIAAEFLIPWDKIPMTLESYGNTSSASIPITLDESVRSGKIQRGDLLYLGTFGGGLTGGGMILRW
jgi:3-oxoacyl-[acyl-carrier-protein] synthase-3